MPLIVSQIKASLKSSKEYVIASAIKLCGISGSDVVSADIHKTSLDARKQNNIRFVHSVIITLTDKILEEKICKNNACCSLVESSRLSPVISNDKRKGDVVIVGFGPAGMFAGLVLAEYGYSPVIIEKGELIDERVASVEKFWRDGILNKNSNVQFGEGGAGTFSDGKLTTRIKDPLCRYVLEKFVEMGAPEEILIKAKPHIGTDKLRLIVKNIRERIISLGGKIYFNTSFEDFTMCDNKTINIKAGQHSINAQCVILAIGHSSRDTFKMIFDKGMFLESKPFSVGARIEHLQDDVNTSLYGKYADNPFLPIGEYQLSYRDKIKDRAVYTFCMCPGGTVVPSSSEENSVVTNGMSEFARNKKNANSAIVVSVSEKDFGKHPLAGVEFARKIEQKSFKLAGSDYSAPSITVGNFLGNEKSSNSIASSYSLGVKSCNFENIFSKNISDMLKTGLRVFSHQMRCFGDMNAILTAPETRTSSPVRITRNDALESISHHNVFPCGEGAGYAGGIMSASVDGIKVALKIIEKYAP